MRNKDKLRIRLGIEVLLVLILLLTTFNIVNALFIGGNDGSYFNGTIDELRIYSKVITPDEAVQNHFSNLVKTQDDKYIFYVNQSKNATAGLSNGTYTYIGYAIDSVGNVNKTEERVVHVSPIIDSNNFPIDPDVILSSVDGTNQNNSDLNCTAELKDTDGDNVNVSLLWFKDDILNLTINYNDNYANGTNFSSTLNSNNLTEGDSWLCSIKITDGKLDSNWVNSSEIIILDVTSPEIMIIWPNGTNLTRRNTWVNYSYYDVNPGYCWYSLNDNANSTSVIAGWNFSSVTFADGYNNLSVYCNDSFGNLNHTNVSFIVNIQSTASNATISNATAATVNNLGCYYKWNCTGWSSCQPDNMYHRECGNVGSCPDTWRKPIEEKECEYEATCYDGIKNGLESDVDCGGRCGLCLDMHMCNSDDDCVHRCDLDSGRCFDPNAEKQMMTSPPSRIGAVPEHGQLIIYVLIALISIILITMISYDVFKVLHQLKVCDYGEMMIHECNGLLGRGKLNKAKKEYMETRELYIRSGVAEKRRLYKKLIKLYERLKKEGNN